MHPRATVIDLNLTMIVPGAGGRRILLKAYGSHSRHRRDNGRLRAGREAICLEKLSGLPVPRFVDVKEPQVHRWVGLRPSAFVAEEVVSGRHLNDVELSDQQEIGVWMFVAELMVAARRSGILYTDLKSENVMVRKRPLSITLIDFDLVCAVRRSRSYWAPRLGYTRGFQAPEHLLARRLTERAVVYQLGMLLASAWMGLHNSTLRRRDGGLSAMRARLRSMGAPALARLLADCLARDPARRPKDYEEVLRRIRAALRRGRPRKALEVWRRLRAPFEPTLAKLGLESP